MVDSSALLDGEGFDCETFEEPVSDGAFKAHNQTPDEVERSVITDRGSDSYFKSSVRIITCLHGILGGEDSNQPATLLVLEYRLHSLKPGHNFKFVRTSFVFKDAAAVVGTPPASPQVIAYAPFHQPQRSNETTSTVTTTQDLGASIGITGGSIATGTINASTSTEESHLQSHFQKGSAGIHYNDLTRLDDTVWWALEQNSSQNLGVQDVFRVAVLIKRKSAADFVGEFKMKLLGSFTYRMGQIGSQIDRFCRRISLDDPVNFSPTKSSHSGKVDGLDRNALGALMRNDSDGLTLPPNYRLDPFLPVN